MNAELNADEIVRALRACGEGKTACAQCPWEKYTGEECHFAKSRAAADLVESLQWQLAEYTTTGLTPGDVKDLQALCEENGLAKYVDLIVEAKRQMGKDNERSIEQDERIEQLESQLAASQRRAQTARNELCLKCGRYREEHNGACDGCRWKGDTNA
jgi:hypothetical protein